MSHPAQLEFDWNEVPQQILSVDEMFQAIDEKLLRRWIEDSRFEKKPPLEQPRSLGNYVCGWANTAPDGGILVVGITRDTEFTGCTELGTNRINDIDKAADIYCPDAICRVRHVQIKRDKDGQSDIVVAIRVFYNETRVVKTSAGKAFIRLGDSLKELKSDEEITWLRAEKGEIRLELEPCGLEYPASFRKDAISTFVQTVQAKEQWMEPHSTEEILVLKHLGKRESARFIPNIACALLFAEDPRMVAPGCRVRFLRFEGEEEQTGPTRNVIKDEILDGTVPELIQKTAEVLSSQLRTFNRIEKGGIFNPTPEYPEFAWYEAVVNGLVHRSYSNGLKNSPLFIKMFDNRLEIQSPGPFPPFVTPANIYEQHCPRNPFLMDAMHFMKYVQCANEGTRRMKREMEKLELPAPEFKQESIGNAAVRVTLRNGINQRRFWVDTDIAAIIGAPLALTLTENEKQCLNFVAINKKIRVNEAVRITGIEWGTARRMLDKLVNKGILVRVHKKLRDPTSFYRMIEARDIQSRERP